MSNRFNIENLKTYTNQEFQALDDAYFKPSNQVWINIHKEIKKEKNNRNGFLLLIGSSIIVLSLLTLTLYKDNPKVETNQLITISENQFEKVKIKQESKDSRKKITQNFNHQQDIHPKIKSFNKIKSRRQINDLITQNKLLYDNKSNLETLPIIEDSDAIISKLDRNEQEKDSDYKSKMSDNFPPLVESNLIQPSLNKSGINPMNPLDILITSISYENNALENLVNPIKKSPVVKEPLTSIGFRIAYFPFKYNKKIKVSSLSETVSSSAYNRTFSVGLQFEKLVSRKFAIVFDPGFRQDQLTTSYNLNIPYDYNTEEKLPNINLNHFSHSLPTDLGNIKTFMTVSRATNSKVEHNELVNIEFQTKQLISTLSLPIGVKYYFENSSKGLSTTVFAAPEFVLSRKNKVDKYLSHHNLVNGDHVDITPEDPSFKYRLTPGISIQYKFPLAHSWSTEMGVMYARDFSKFGRDQILNFNLSICKSIR
ncbi:MAG: hypothetical protein IPI30_18945 [Saprospiraceae bacterium]|nr:hypothetical protein [Candidatus Vicinibacter affinis]